MAPVDKLPVELLLDLFSYLNPDERRKLRSVCRAWKTLIEKSTTIKLHMNEDNIQQILQSSQSMKHIELAINNLTTPLIVPPSPGEDVIDRPNQVSTFLNKLQSVELNGNFNSRNFIEIMLCGDQIKMMKFLELEMHDLEHLREQLDLLEAEKPKRTWFRNLETLVIKSATHPPDYLPRILEQSGLKNVRLIEYEPFSYKDPFRTYLVAKQCPIYKILHSNKRTMETFSVKSAPNAFGSSKILVKFHEYKENQSKQRIHSFMSSGNHPQLELWLNKLLPKQTELKVLRIARFLGFKQPIFLSQLFKRIILDIANKNFATLESFYLQKYHLAQNPKQETPNSDLQRMLRAIPQRITLENWNGSDFQKLTSLKHISLHYFPHSHKNTINIFSGIELLPPTIQTLNLSIPINFNGIKSISQLQPMQNLQGLETLNFEFLPWFSFNGFIPGTLSLDDINNMKTIFPRLKEFQFSATSPIKV